MTTPEISRLTQVLRNQGQPIQQFIAAPTWVDILAVSSTHAEYTLPTGASILRLTPLSAALPAYGNFNGNAAAPSTGVTDGSASFPVISQTTLVAPVNTEKLSLIAAGSSYVVIEVWS